MTLSKLYRLVLRRPDLHTFTSLYRAYSREAARDARSSAPDYLALTESLVSLIDRGYRVVEHPAVLRVRTAGVSKMRVLRMVRRHAAMVVRLAARRTPRPATESEGCRA
jgi:hypothetical protein